LEELGARLQTALERLEPTIGEQKKKYFEGAVKRIKASLPLGESDERELEEFGSRCSALLEQAARRGANASRRWQKLWSAGGTQASGAVEARGA